MMFCCWRYTLYFNLSKSAESSIDYRVTAAIAIEKTKLKKKKSTFLHVAFIHCIITSGNRWFLQLLLPKFWSENAEYINPYIYRYLLLSRKKKKKKNRKKNHKLNDWKRKPDRIVYVYLIFFLFHWFHTCLKSNTDLSNKYGNTWKHYRKSI